MSQPKEAAAEPMTAYQLADTVISRYEARHGLPQRPETLRRYVAVAIRAALDEQRLVEPQPRESPSAA